MISVSRRIHSSSRNDSSSLNSISAARDLPLYFAASRSASLRSQVALVFIE